MIFKPGLGPCDLCQPGAIADTDPCDTCLDNYVSRRRRRLIRLAAILEILACLWLCTGCGMPLVRDMGNPPKAQDPALPKMTGLAITGAVVTAAGVAATAIPVAGPAVGVPIAMGGLTLLTLAFVLAKYGWLLALGGLIVILAGFIFVAVAKLRTYKTSLTEVVTGIQKAKNEIAPSQRATINAKLAGVQSDATTALVNMLKKKAGLNKSAVAPTPTLAKVTMPPGLAK